MELVFTDEATHDLNHIREFLSDAGIENYREIIEEIIAGASLLTTFPRAGVPVLLAENPDEVRDLIHKNFVLRYRIMPGQIQALRIWHHRENQRN